MTRNRYFPFLLIILDVSGATLSAEPPQAAQWEAAKTHELDGCKVSLSKPVLVARSRGYLWFPSLTKLADGSLLAEMTDYADRHTNFSTSLASWSSDGGLTWSAPIAGRYSGIHLRLAGGDELLLPYYLNPQSEGVIGAPYQICPRGKRELKLVEPGVSFNGWPRPVGTTDAKLGLAGFVCNGQTVTCRDGTFLATLYGHYRDAKRYSLVVAESSDGVQWRIRSTVADDSCPLEGREGPCEAAICRLADGRLMCVFRLAAFVPYGQSWSSDDGKTWTAPVAMKTAFSVQPSLAVMPDGTVLLSGGRRGLFLWIDLAGKGENWQQIEFLSHHNTCVPAEPIKEAMNTSAYTEVVAMDDRHFLIIYDRIPHSWQHIPADSAETNSVWVLQGTIEK